MVDQNVLYDPGKTAFMGKNLFLELLFQVLLVNQHVGFFKLVFFKLTLS